MTNCSNCPLNGRPRIGDSGPEEARIAVVGEAPGAQEVAERRPFVGPSGKLLRAVLGWHGVDANEVFMTNTVQCRPKGNKKPSKAAISACSSRLKRDLRAVDPEVILLLGRTAQSALEPRNQKIGISKYWKGSDTVLLPNWHPAFILRQPYRMDEFELILKRAAHGRYEPDLLDYPEVVWAEDLQNLLSHCPSGARVALDIETDQTRWYPTLMKPRDEILMMQLLWDYDYSVVVPGKMLYNDPETRQALEDFFRRVLIGGHNLKFDAVFLKTHLGLDIPHSFDTMLAKYILNENLSGGLKTLGRLELGMPNWEGDMVKKYMKSRNDRWSKIPSEVLAKYGVMDVAVTRYLWNMYEEELKAQGRFKEPFQSIIMAASETFTDVEIRGMNIDVERLNGVATELKSMLDGLETEMQEMTGKPELNPRSWQQVGAVLYDQLGFPTANMYNKPARTTCAAQLEKLQKNHGHPFIDLMLEHRHVQKLYGSYAKNLLKNLGRDGRVHADFKINGTEVGRISVRRPALQTIPRPGTPVGSLIRNAFTAPEGYVLIEADYSQAELRCLACLAGEPFLIQVYKDGRDLHSEVARTMYGDDFTKEDRVRTKMFNFSYAYGGTEHSFAKDTGLHVSQAREFVRDYNAHMPRLKQYRLDQYEKLNEQGYVETITGRRRHFKLITKHNKDDARKACVHMPVAGSASDLTLLSGIRLNAMGYRVILLVHDSVFIEVEEEFTEQACEDMAKVMNEIAAKVFPQVPWPMKRGRDVEVKKEWAENLLQTS